MNKKLLVLVGLIALGVGGVSTIALQSHAQKAPVQPTTTASAAAAPASTQENDATDADNVQNDPGGVEKPDATSTLKQGDTQEQGEGVTVNPNETEDGN
jgi:hypothetical protein